jgi:hypothetical protein
MRSLFVYQGKPNKMSLGVIVLLLVSAILKSKVYNRMVPASDTLSLIS